MSFQVTVEPSGHGFSVEARESLLAAGLREGLNLSYRCDNGSCGDCRARLKHGELERLRSQDYRLTPSEIARGDFLMCCQRPASDCVIEAHEVGHAAEIPRQHIAAKVAKFESLGQDVRLLNVRTPRSQGLQFLAGQSVTVSFGDGLSCILPIASCPCNGLHLRFHVRRRPGDAFSAFVFERLKRNQPVTLDGPLGAFTLDEDSDRPAVFIAWESGFAAAESLIDHAIQLDPDRQIRLIWLSALPNGHYQKNYCRAWQDALDDFHFDLLSLQRTAGSALVALYCALVRQIRPLNQADYYLILPPAFINDVQAWLLERGVSRLRIHSRLKHHP